MSAAICSALGRYLPSRGVWLATGLALQACAAPAAGPEVPADRCQLRVWFRPERALARPDLTDRKRVPRPLTREQVEQAQVIGSWNGFARPGIALLDERIGRDGERWQTVSLPLPPGTYDYGIEIGDFIVPDDISPQGSFGPDPRYLDSRPFEVEWTRFEVPDCGAPTLRFEQIRSASDGRLRGEALYLPGRLGERGLLAPGQLAVRLTQARIPLTPPTLRLAPEGAGQRITIDATGLPPGKYTLTLDAQPAGRTEGPALSTSASAFVEPALPGRPPELAPAPPLADGVVYHVLLDRFLGDEGTLPPPRTPGRRAGGTLRGLLRAVEAGYFARLGVTTLWLSPVYENPPGLFTGRDGNQYESYHGYWPMGPRSVEPRLGGTQALRELVAAAHTRGLRVIFDAVPNHVFAEHPAYQLHSRRRLKIASLPARKAEAESWFSDADSACICGSPGCGWGERIEDCWFDRYLPDVNWRHPAAAQAGVDDLLWWLDHFDLDGMRIDAVPMMPRPATRRMVRAAREQRLRSGLDLLLLGENYTGPGSDGRLSIRSFLGRSYDGLDSAFDFPLMWAMRAALAKETIGLDALEAEIVASQAAWAGSGATMGLILDNHDTPRFLSEAAGNAGNDPWKDPPPQPRDDEPYRKLGLGLTLLYTLPGLPVIYYGDELGLAGANDPDSRRVLPKVPVDRPRGPGDPADSELLPPQAALLSLTEKLAALRRCLPQLRRGTRTSLWAEPEVSVAAHTARDTEDSEAARPALVVLSRARNDKRVFVPRGPAPSLSPGRYRDALSGDELVVTGEATSSPTLPLTVRALRPAIYLADGHRCLSAPSPRP
jgi:glycosidase